MHSFYSTLLNEAAILSSKLGVDIPTLGGFQVKMEHAIRLNIVSVIPGFK